MVEVLGMSKTKAHIRYKDSQGNILPGVTTIIAELGWNKQALIKWANNLGLKGMDSSKFRDEKANVGKLAHLMIMNYLKGDKTDTSEYSQKEIEQAENSFLSFLEWEKGHKLGYGLEIMRIEEPIISEKYHYGGTPDFYGYINGDLELIDFKTGSGIYDEYIIQVSSYYYLIEEQHNFDEKMKARILRIPRSEDEAFEERLVSERELEIGWDIFWHCLEIYRLRKQWKTK